MSRLRGFRGSDLVPWLGWLFVAAVIFWLAVNLWKEPSDFVAVALEGLTLGLVYGLIALGYSLVYGILELINFAHGDVFMLGSWASFAFAANRLGLNADSSGFTVVWGLGLTLLVAMAFCGILNVTIERLAYRPLRNAPRLAPLITAIGVSFIL
ncbi:MAG: ABC transporter permease subunit, partial [Gaiellaceae bacterium]